MKKNKLEKEKKDIATENCNGLHIPTGVDKRCLRNGNYYDIGTVLKQNNNIEGVDICEYKPGLRICDWQWYSIADEIN